MAVATIRKRSRTGNHIWTDDERDIIRRDYKGTRESVQVLSGKIGASFYGVKGQIQKMGLSLVKKHTWTPREEEYLRENIQRFPLHAIGRNLHISTGAVMVKSKKMKLRRSLRDGWYTKKDVCEILGLDHRQVQTYMDCGAIKATYHSEKKPGQEGMAMWHIDEGDLRSFIISHSFELIGRNVDLFQIIQIITGGKE